LDQNGYVADHSAGEAELGMGYFNSFGPNKQVRFSVQGGINLGVADDVTRSNSYYIDLFGPYYNVFCQPSLGLVRKHFELAVSGKLSLGQMASGGLDPSDYNETAVNLMSFESATRISYGFEKWKLFFQFSTITGNPNFDRVRLLQSEGNDYALPFNASIGIKKTFGAQ
jgi:hypothetical protein